MSYRDNIANIDTPPYTRKQETFNTISHLIGIPVALIILIIGTVRLISGTVNISAFLGLLVFIITIVDVYLVSSLYHWTPNETFNKKVFRVLDHCTIFLLIAGTYTPICVILMDTNIIGLIMLIIEWGCAFIGIILNAFFFKNKIARIVSMALYLGMGWLLVFFGGFQFISVLSFAFILGGGIIYSIGAILYAVGKKNLNFHCIFHVFVIVSTIVQAVGVLALYF